MTFVEHFVAELHWGHSLAVMREADLLLVRGVSPMAPSDESSRDLLQEFRAAPRDWSQKYPGKEPPHVQFANAETDEELTEFVKKFGPLVVGAVRSKDSAKSVQIVEQDMSELRRERIVYRGALRLVSELAKGSNCDTDLVADCVLEIAEGARNWPEQWNREQKMRGDYSEPGWRFDKLALRRLEVYAEKVRQHLSGTRSDYADIFDPAADPIETGHLAICVLVNAFRPTVFRLGEVTLEGPYPNLFYGIRPLLYYILRRLYLGYNSVAICANEKCRELFEVNRADSRFCGPDCSRQQRQREYWAEKGKERRAARKSSKRKAKRGSTQKQRSMKNPERGS